MRVMRGHAEDAAVGRSMAQNELTDKRIDVAVLQQGCECVAPRLGTCGVGAPKNVHKPDERNSNGVGFDGAGIAPDATSNGQSLLPSKVFSGVALASFKFGFQGAPIAKQR